MKRLTIFALALCSFLIGAETPTNLFATNSFKPIYMHGKVTGVLGWNLVDGPRNNYNRYTGRYLSGEDCFKMDFQNGVLSFQFPGKFPDGYDFSKSNMGYWPITCIRLSNRANDPMPPAPQYRVKARVRFNKGKCALNGNLNLKAGAEWNVIDVVRREPFKYVNFIPQPGSKFEFADFQSQAVYPNIGGAIALPDGGKLTKFIIPENASFLVRWNVSLWRGWLWKLTGTALPIEVSKNPQPTAGAFVALQDQKVANGAWKLTVDKKGIVLRYRHDLSIASALFDYLRRAMGCAFYERDCQKLPKDGSVKQLAKIDFTAKPRYSWITGDGDNFARNGGVYLGALYTANDVDYYHLPLPTNDHVLNVILPMEMYFKTHPEYYSLNGFGKRFASANPHQTNPCYSSKAGMDIMVKNSVIYAKNQVASHYFNISPGDVGSHCVCPACVKLNGGKTDCSDVVMDYTNKVAAVLEKEAPHMIVKYGAYATRHTVPVNVKMLHKNIRVDYCLGQDVLPCTLHVDCPINRPGIEQIKKWLAYCGNNPFLMGYETYRDIRPLHHQKQMAFLNQFAKDQVYMFYWKGYSPATQFIMARWNLGEDTEKLLLEFDRAYFGKGGDIMFQIDKRVEEWAMNYKHTDQQLHHLRKGTHLCIWGDDPESCTLMDRAFFDELYPMFDKALAAAGNDKKARSHILREKGRYLVEDLHKYNRSSCKNKEEVAGFTKRLIDLMNFAKEAGMNNCMYGVPSRKFVYICSGLEIPTTPRTFWTDEPFVKAFKANPAKYFSSEPDIIPNGWYFKPVVMQSARPPHTYTYECPPRMCASTARPSLGEGNKISVSWNLPVAPKRPLFLAIEGLDDDKPGKSSFKVLVNGKKIFEGPCTFPEKEWGRMGFMMPAEVLKAGENTIQVVNVTPDVPNRSARYPNDLAQAKLDGQWGWMSVSEIYVLDVENSFQELMAGKRDPNSRWNPNSTDDIKKPGVNKIGNGRIVMTAKEGEKTQISYFGKGLHVAQKIASNVIIDKRNRRVADATYVATIRAKGSGKLSFRIATYDQYLRNKDKSQKIQESGYAFNGNHYYTYPSKPFVLTDKEQVFTFEMRMPGGTGMCYPQIRFEGPGEAIVTDFTFRLKEKAIK